MHRGRTGLFVGLGGLYLAQGVIAAFGSNVLLPQLAATGVTLDYQVELLTLGMVPWVLKLLWAVVLDLVFGPNSGTRRRTLLVSISLVCTLIALWLSLTPRTPEALASLTWLWVALNFAASVQDVTTDGLAVDLLEPEERGAGNTWMQVGTRMGQLGLGALLLATVTTHYGLDTAMAVWVGILGVCVLAPFMLPRQRLQAPANRPHTPVLTALLQLRTTPKYRIGALAGLAMVGSALTSAVAPTFLFQELGLTYNDYTYTLLPLMVVCTLLSGPVSHHLLTRVGVHRAFVAGTVAVGLVWAVFGLAEPLWSFRGTLLALVCVESVATVICFSALYGLLMAHTQPRIRAVHFTALMILVNLGRTVAPNFAPELLADLGYAGIWITCGIGQMLLAIPALLLARGYAPTQATNPS